MVVVLGALATGMAFFVARIGDIIQGFSTFMSLFSAPILALFLLGMLTRNGHFKAWAFGAVVAIATTWCVQAYTPLNWTYYFPISFLVCFGLAVLLSRLWPAPTAAAERVLVKERP